MEEKKTKKSKKKLILLLSIVVVLLLSAGFGIAWMSGILTFGGNQTNDKLYWNVAEQTYLNGAGFSTRQVEDDGYYHVTLAVDGEQVEYKVKDKTLVDDIDNRDVMGLEIDKDGVITAVLDPKEVGDGESISQWYVVSIEEDSFKVRQTRGAESGLSYQVKLTEDTGCYDVTGKGTIGEAKEIAIDDCVRVFRNFDKEVNYIFVVRGANYFAGNIVKDYCEHCETEVDWYEWTETTAAPNTSQHWRLMNDVSLNYHTDIIDYQDVIIDLNGYKIEAEEGRRVFRIGDSKSQGTLAIVDQSKNGTGTLKASGNTRDGGVVQVKAGTFNFYSGTIDASEVDTERFGCGVHMIASTTFNMYGGTIIGGTTTCGRTYSKGTTGGGGGSVYVNSGATFTMYDGTIRDGKVVAYQKKEGGYNWGIGGNIDIRNGGTFIMEGGKILNGTADRNGGNVYVTANAATFIMRGGEISGGKCITSGGANGNVYVGKDSTFQFEGGTIKDGTVYNGGGGNVGVYGLMKMSGGHITGGLSVAGETFEKATKREDQDWHNVYVSAGGVLEMSGGSVDGYVRINAKECMVKLSGTARITGADANLSLVKDSVMRIGELTKGAKIGVTGGGFISEETSQKYLAYITSDYDEVDIQYYKSKFFMGKIACLCGGSHIDSDGNKVTGHYGTCDGTQLEWMPWGNKANAPTVTGNWYLITDVQLVAQKGVAVDTKMVLDLNGHTITGKENTRVYYIAKDRNIQMTITDNSAKQSGKIQSVGEYKLSGSCLLVMPGNEVVMYAGTLDASNFKEIGGGGATLAIRQTSKFTMYGGTIVGGTATTNGGAVVSEGTFVLKDGIIRDGKASTAGGNVYVSNGEFIMTGGKIIDGSANYYNAEGKSAGAYNKGVGGNLYIQGPNKKTYVNATITGGTIEGGKTNGRGGNIQVHQYANLVLGTKDAKETNAVVISGGETFTGGNVFGRGNSTITVYNGVTIKDGKASNQGGNIFFDSNQAFTVSGGNIQDGTAKEGGNIFFSNKVTAQIQGGTVSGGSATIKGGNIYTAGNLNMTGGTVTGGKAIAEVIKDKNGKVTSPSYEKGIGGNICIVGTGKDKYATVTITGGTIEKGEANGRGGNIDAHQYTNLILGTEDATSNDLAQIIDGKAENTLNNASGGNIFARGDSTFTMYNGVTIKDGNAVNQGGNIFFDSNKEFAINGGVVEGGTAKEGGNIIFSNKFTGTIAGGTISGGTAATNGGNIYNQGTLTVSGGTITGGTAVAGGNIYNVKTLKVIDGTISGGTATNGGSIYTTKTLNVEGGTISGGSATNSGGNIYTSGKMTMTGGTITGGKAMAADPNYDRGIGGNILAAGTKEEDKDAVYATVTITGGTIEKGEVNGRGGNIDAHQYANLILGAEDAEKNDLAIIAEGKVNNTEGNANGGNIFARGDSTFTMYNGVTIKDGNAVDQGGNIFFDSKKTFAINGGVVQNGTAREGGNIYFSNKLTGTIAGGTISGGTATEEGGNINNLGTLTVSGGTITGGTAVAGGNIYNVKTLNVTGGTISNGTATNGGNIYLQATQTSATKSSAATMEMTGGTISGGTATDGGSIYVARGVFEDAEGKMYSKAATLKLSGGTISGGTATNSGGNIFTAGTLTMSGGTITGGKAMAADPNFDRGIGGNICAASADANNYATVTITGGTIEKGEVNGRGGNIDAHQNTNLVLGSEDATSNDLAIIAEGKVSNTEKNANGGNIFARSNSTFTMYNGVTIKDGNAVDQGGNIFFDSNKAFAINGGVVQNGTAREGGNIFFSSKFTGTIAGGTISGGTATEEGGNIHNQGKLTVSGGTITGGTAANGGNIHLYAVRSSATKGSAATMTMSGGTISNGTATLGGNIYIDRGFFKAEDGTYTNTAATMTMSGGTIQNGWATTGKYGGNIYLNGQLTMNGGTIKEGKAGTASVSGGRGGNIFVNRGTDNVPGKLIVNAGSILDGKANERGGNVMLDHGDMEIGTGLITITGGEKVTFNEDGSVNKVNGTSNLDMYATSTHDIVIAGALNTESRIGYQSSNTSSFAKITAANMQEASVYTTVFVCDSSSYKITVSTTGKTLSYAKK